MTYIGSNGYNKGMVLYTYEDLCKPELAQELLDAGASRAWEVDAYIHRTRGPNAAIDGDAWRLVNEEAEHVANITRKIKEDLLPRYSPADAQATVAFYELTKDWPRDARLEGEQP